MTNVNLEYYRIFYHVAKYENFTRAARILGSNQPNVTRAMNRLEEEIGCVLFIRTNRGIRLTPEGEHLYAYVKGAMAQIHQAEEELSALNALTSGSVSIGASETALNSYLLEILKNFHLEYPHIRIRISNTTTRTAMAAVKNGEVDLPWSRLLPRRMPRFEAFRFSPSERFWSAAAPLPLLPVRFFLSPS